MIKIREMGLRQEILSASEEVMLGRQLQQLGVDRLVDGYWGMGTIHAGGKEELGRAWRRANPDARVLLIGDTTHDARVASVIGADCILFEGGHMSRRRLLSCGVPTFRSFSDWFELRI
jgi:phosphoglycolate phosphatase